MNPVIKIVLVTFGVIALAVAPPIAAALFLLALFGQGVSSSAKRKHRQLEQQARQRYLDERRRRAVRSIL